MTDVVTEGSRLDPVHLLDLPVELWRLATEHQEALQRELDIIRAGQADVSVANRLFTLIRDLDGRFGGMNDDVRDELLAAVDEGASSIDVTYAVPPEAGEAAQTLGDMLDEVDAYCRAGDQLISVATPPELVLFRRWFLGEFVRQLQGEPPLSWPRYRDSHRPEEVIGPPSAEKQAGSAPPASASEWSVRGDGHQAVVAVATALDLVSAPSLRDLLQDLLNGGVQDLTIDLTDATFMDSVALSLFVTTHDRLRSSGGRLRLVVGDRLFALLQTAELTGTLLVEKYGRSG